MKYYIFTLKFLTPVHFGDSAGGGSLERVLLNCSADTLFSALCNEMADNQEILNDFVAKTASGKIMFSSLMPFYRIDDKDLQLYLPKPLLNGEVIAKTEQSFTEIKQLATKLKKKKKEAYIRASQIKRLLKTGQNDYDGTPKFAVPYVAARVGMRGEKSLPYYVGSYLFSKQTGLYLICGTEDETDIDFVENALISLGLSGIGGKRSSGYGKFELEDDKWEIDAENGFYEDDIALGAMLVKENAAWQMCIAPVCPVRGQAENIKQGNYKLLKRSGFVPAFGLDNNVKRNSIFMLAEGSCFAKRVQGRMVELDVDGLNHKIYRNGVGMFVGLDDE